jgi:hypothetical protein
MKKTSLVLIALLISSKSYSLALRGLCFDRNTNLNKVKNYVSQIIAPGDKVLINSSKHCIELVVDEKRVELFEKFISMNYRVTSRYGGEANFSKKECLFEVENIKKKNSEGSSIHLSNSSHARSLNSDSLSTSKSTLRVMERKLAQLLVNNNLITISCKIRGRVTQVDISLGSKKSNLITSIEMSKGQRINLASIVKDLSDKNRGIKVSTGTNSYGVEYGKSSGTEKEDFFLTLK